MYFQTHSSLCRVRQKTQKGKGGSFRRKRLLPKNIMKKIIITTLSALLVLCGCSAPAAADPVKPEEENAEPEKQTEPITLEADEEDSELETMAVVRSPKPGTLEGSYISANTSLAPYEPSVMFYSDGTFVYTENVYEGLQTYRGAFTYDGTNIICKVAEQDYPGFYDLSEIRFSKINDSVIRLETDITSSRNGDIFIFVNQYHAPGSFISTATGWAPNCEPNITFKEDGSFVMVENLLEGMGKYTGIYQYDGRQYRCKVQTVDFKGFAGDSVKEIVFRTFNDSLISLGTALCGSTANTYFARYEPAPESAPGSHTAPPPSTEKTGTVFIAANADSNRIKVRSGPGLSAADTGERKYSGEKVTVYEEVSKDGYTWYRIGKDKWMAGNGTSFGVKYD